MQMHIVIEKLIEFCAEYKVAPSIRFVPDFGSMFIYIDFDYKDKRISHIFYYTMSPSAETCIEHFKMYEPCFELEIERMIKELKDTINTPTINDRWCNTCEYKHLESECLGCAVYDECDNLIDLRNYKKEE